MSNTMALNGYRRCDSLPLRMGSLGCRPPTEYFGIDPAITPPESVTADDADVRDCDIADEEFSPGTSEALVQRARDILDAEAHSLRTLSALLAMDTFIPFIRIMHQCRGHIVLTGIGKSALIAQKMSATLASTGRPSFFLHSAEALHGDMGRITHRDIVIALSNSGEGPELTQIAKTLKETTFRIDDSMPDDEYVDNPFRGAKFLLITGNARSSLTRYADAILSIGDMREACSFNVVPTNTTTAMLALGDALALCLFELLSGRRYSIKTFANFHPGGSLGKKLMRVQHAMRPCGSLIQTNDTIRHVITTLDINCTGKNSIAVVVDPSFHFVRLFSDRDLRQLLLLRFPGGDSIPLNSSLEASLHYLSATDYPPCRINQKMLLGDAHRIMKSHNIDTAVVIDERQFPIGVISL
jgi:arabinose-5-phosphate isomerase